MPTALPPVNTDDMLLLISSFQAIGHCINMHNAEHMGLFVMVKPLHYMIASVDYWKPNITSAVIDTEVAVRD